MNRIEMSGYSTMKSLCKMRFLDPPKYGVTEKQRPIKYLCFPRVYDHAPKNYWFKSPNKINKYLKVKITIEVLTEERPQ